jgi:hypothetical protein
MTRNSAVAKAIPTARNRGVFFLSCIVTPVAMKNLG